MPNKKRGGARRGAGRPPSATPAIRRNITLPQDVFDMLERMRGDIPRSTFIQKLIMKNEFKNRVTEELK